MTGDSELRLIFFSAALGGMLLWEWWRPFRSFQEPKHYRLGRHLALMALNFVLLRLLSGGGAMATAVAAAQQGWGLLADYEGPAGFRFIAGLLALDFAIYAQHIAFHKVSWLWRLHKVHHSDIAFDTTTAIRFHPIEILLSMFFKMGIVLSLGLSPSTVLTFEILLNACAQFNHGNVSLPAGLERTMRWLLITPSLHRIHHSTVPRETDSNFGFSVPWWDHLCGTYCAAPRLGQERMEIGLDEERDPDRLRLAMLLRLPFRPEGGPRSI